MKLDSLLATLIMLAASTTSIAFKPTSTALAVTQSIPRGGAGPLSPETAAKITGYFTLAQGAACVLAPGPAVAQYQTQSGIKSLNETNKKLMVYTGLNLMNLGVYVYCLVFKNYNLKVPSALTSLLFASTDISSLLNDDCFTTGPCKAGNTASLVVNLMPAIFALNDSPLFENAFKFQACFFVASGLLALFAPTLSMKLWGMKGDDEMTAGSMVGLGANICNYGTLISLLAFSGKDPIQCIGYTAAVALLVSIKCNFFSPEFEVLEYDKGPLLFWAIFDAVIAASILL